MTTFKERLEKAMFERRVSAAELSRLTGIWASSISDYLAGKYEAKQNKIALIAKALRVDPAWLMGADTEMERAFTVHESHAAYDAKPPEIPDHPDIFRPKLKRVPLLGTTAAGEPLMSDEIFEDYVDCYAADADFCLHVKGDSMIGIGINDGDIVFVKSQNTVENGQVAVVRINGDAVTLKRFYRQDNNVMLVSENPNIPTFILNANNTEDLKILGLAVIKQSKIN